MKKACAWVLAAALLWGALPVLGETPGRIYFLGNFYFGMPIREVRALDQTNAALTQTDPARETQCVTLVSDGFVISLWFRGLEEDAALAEMDVAFYMRPDKVVLGEKGLEIRTTALTVRTVRAYVENYCKAQYGAGRAGVDGALPLPSLAFPEEKLPSLTQACVYTRPDGSGTDVVTHAVVTGPYRVNHIIIQHVEGDAPAEP